MNQLGIVVSNRLTKPLETDIRSNIQVNTEISVVGSLDGSIYIYLASRKQTQHVLCNICGSMAGNMRWIIDGCNLHQIGTNEIDTF